MNKKTEGNKLFKNNKRDKFQMKVLGPVQDLEEHVDPNWWWHIFNSLYLKTDGDVVEDKNITIGEVDMLLSILSLSPEDGILDLCCGQGRHSLELAKRGFKYIEGLDRSHYLIQKAKTKAKKEGLGVRFREGDARKLQYPHDAFNVVMILGNSFGYFETIEDDMRVLREVLRVLKPWGKLYIDVADGEYLKKNFQPHSWEWIDKKLFVCRERSLSIDEQRLISREVVTHVGKGVIADQFYAERLYSSESITQILIKAGFSDVVFHGQFSTDSQRNQDLGMMERRLIITSVVKKEWTAIKRKPKQGVTNVAVILGDPNKPDPLKPYLIFDENDLYTVDKLKSALRELEGNHFFYFNNHDTLIQDLMKERGKIDIIFNLCDEGLYNEGKKELHIPALLEILGLSYTGSGPQCLAFCYDKSLVRGIAKEMEIPVPEAFFLKPEDTTFELPFSFPAIVKPNFGDGSFGITQKSVAYNAEEIINAVSEIREKFGYNKFVIVEEFLPGKDLSVGIIGNPPESYQVLPIIEEDYSMLPDTLPRVCGYEAKWLPDSPYWNIKSIPAELPENTERLIIEWCLKLFERLDCKDYCRFDWRLDALENPRLLEVNPNPGWCWDGHLAKMAKVGDISYSEMLRLILNAAGKRVGVQTMNAAGKKEAHDSNLI